MELLAAYFTIFGIEIQYWMPTALMIFVGYALYLWMSDSRH
jgi:hypothetical protein